MRSAPSRAASRYHRPRALDEADRVDGAPPCRLVPRGVPQPQPLAREDRAADRGQVQVGVRVAQPPAPVDQHPVRRVDGLPPGRVGHRRDDLADGRGERGSEPQRLGRGPGLRGEQRERLVVGQPGEVRGEAGQQGEPAVAATFGVDRDSRRGQRFDVAEHRACRNLQLAGQLRRCHPTSVAQQQDEGEQAVRTHARRIASIRDRRCQVWAAELPS